MYNLLLLILSFAMLCWAANQLVIGAAGIAHYFNIPQLIIGFILLGLVTSMPQILLAIYNTLDASNYLAVGSAVGANIANIGLILGIVALIRPLSGQPLFLQREFPLLFLAMLFIYSLMLDGYLGVVDSCLLLLFFVLGITYILHFFHPATVEKRITETFRQHALKRISLKHYVICLTIGLVILSISTKLLVNTLSLIHIYGSI